MAMLLYSTGAAGSAHAAGGARATSGKAATHPQVVYSTYLGGSDFDSYPFTALDRFGNLYVAGQTCSSDFPIIVGAFQTTPGGGCDAYVAKLAADGKKLIYSTYLGGSDVDTPSGLDVDAAGNAYVTGDTLSTDFPTTPGAFQTSNPGGLDAFVTKLNPSGSALVYSTYLGGTSDELGGAGRVDAAGRIYVTGSTGSVDFPVTKGAFQTAFAGGDGEHCGFPCDAFVLELNRAGSGLISSTYVGGTGDELCCSERVDRYGRAHISGATGSTDFPTTPGAVQPSFGGGDIDTFVTTLNAGGSALVSSTYLGGDCTDFPGDLTIDGQGNTYVAGATCATDFPTTPGVFQPALTGFFDGFLTKLNPGASALVYSTYIGGTGAQFADGGVVVDRTGNAYVSGVTTSTDFPVTDDAIQPTFSGGDGTICFGLPCDGWLMKLNPDASAPLFSTYLGGSGDDWAAVGLQVDGSGNVYVPGYTDSTDFPTTEGAFQTSLAGSVDAFAMKIELGKDKLGHPSVRRGPSTPAENRGWPSEAGLGWHGLPLARSIP